MDNWVGDWPAVVLAVVALVVPILRLAQQIGDEATTSTIR